VDDPVQFGIGQRWGTGSDKTWSVAVSATGAVESKSWYAA